MKGRKNEGIPEVKRNGKGGVGEEREREARVCEDSTSWDVPKPRALTLYCSGLPITHGPPTQISCPSVHLNYRPKVLLVRAHFARWKNRGLLSIQGV